MDQKILIVDDDSSICEILEFNLKSEGYEVESAYSAEEALKKMDTTFSLILLDVMMGGMSGYKMAEKLRNEKTQTPIIFLTAKDNENDMLTGFSVGGDDYISKPFSIKEVLARVKAVLQRSQSNKTDSGGRVEFDGFQINFDKKELIIDDQLIKLTKKEYDILGMLAKSQGRYFTRENIIDRVWSDDTFVTSRTVDVHITRLRKKMGKYASVISSRSGFGYKFETA